MNVSYKVPTCTVSERGVLHRTTILSDDEQTVSTQLAESRNDGIGRAKNAPLVSREKISNERSSNVFPLLDPNVVYRMNLHIFLVLLINTAISLAEHTSTSMSTFLFTSESVNEGHPGTFVVSSLPSSNLRPFSFRRSRSPHWRSLCHCFSFIQPFSHTIVITISFPLFLRINLH
jgi:hypothetical protein